MGLAVSQWVSNTVVITLRLQAYRATPGIATPACDGGVNLGAMAASSLAARTMPAPSLDSMPFGLSLSGSMPLPGLPLSQCAIPAANSEHWSDLSNFQAPSARPALPRLPSAAPGHPETSQCVAGT